MKLLNLGNKTWLTEASEAYYYIDMFVCLFVVIASIAEEDVTYDLVVSRSNSKKDQHAAYLYRYMSL